jgi:hypothetical protein
MFRFNNLLKNNNIKSHINYKYFSNNIYKSSKFNNNLFKLQLNKFSSSNNNSQFNKLNKPENITFYKKYLYCPYLSKYSFLQILSFICFIILVVLGMIFYEILVFIWIFIVLLVIVSAF